MKKSNLFNKYSCLDKGDSVIPWYVQLRESTSYQIIISQIERLSQEAGVELIAEEQGSYSEGDDTMHEVLIYPKGIIGKERYEKLSELLDDKEATPTLLV